MDLSILEQVLRRCNDGEPVAALCREYGLKRHTLYTYCKRHGIRLESKYIRRPFKFDKCVREQIVEEYKNGSGSSSIAKKYKIGHHSVLNYLKEAGLRARTKEERREINGLPIVNYLRAAYEKEATRRKRIFSLSYDEFEHAIFGNCYYCGIEPNQGNKNYKGVYYNGIDRIDSSKGYVIGNIVTSCFRCNAAKNNMTVKEFKDWIRRILNNGIMKKLDRLM